MDPKIVDNHPEIAVVNINEDYIYVEMEEFIVVPSKVLTSVKDTSTAPDDKYRVFNNNRGIVLKKGNLCKNDNIKVGDTVFVREFDMKVKNVYGAGDVSINQGCNLFSFMSQEEANKYTDEKLFVPNTGVIREHQIIGSITPH